MQPNVQLKFSLPEPQMSYLEHCARIRNVSVNRLLRDVIKVTCVDQLCEAILDDASLPRQPNQSRGYRGKDYPL